MRIGGTGRDNLMTLIPIAIAFAVALILLGGPDDALRALARLGDDLVALVGGWFRR